ncbi:MAG: hypothetical protein RLP44_08640 [Aggregatilineales bacterium]
MMPTTTDPVPEHRNRFAYWIGRIFHPYVVCIPTLFAVLYDLTLRNAVVWSMLVLILVLVPGISMIVYLRRQDRWVYQRQTRGPIYAVVWASVLFCLIVLLVLDAPDVLAACIATLCVWVPVQWLINYFVTKISTHMAVIGGCGTALWWLGILDTPVLQLAVIGIALLTMWSRIETKNHTLAQVMLGLLVGSGSVLVAFPLLLG